MTRFAHLLALAFMFCAGCCNPPNSHALDVPLKAQETSLWCWAASGEMCMDLLGTDVTQCDQANKRFGHTDCCNQPTPTHCILGGWPEFEKYSFTVSKTSWGDALSWNAIRKQIYCRRKPFCFSWGWSGGGGHMMVTYGYATTGNQNYVRVNNPWPPGSGAVQLITYEHFVSQVNDHEHWVDYYDITKK